MHSYVIQLRKGSDPRFLFEPPVSSSAMAFNNESSGGQHSAGNVAAAVADSASVIIIALENHFANDIAPFLLHHPASWRPNAPKRHFGFCGQDCGCCRSHNPADAAEGCNCQCCFTGWKLSRVSTSMRCGLRTYVISCQHSLIPYSLPDKWNGCKGWNGWIGWNEWDWWNKWNYLHSDGPHCPHLVVERAARQ